MITGPEPGLTRDAVASRLHDAEGEIELVDTAGLRRKARVEEALEKMSVSASIEALKFAEVVVLCVDAVLGFHDQDLQIARLVEREGRACVLVLSKWDAVPDRAAARRAVADRLETSLAQMKGILVVTLSGLTGAGVEMDNLIGDDPWADVLSEPGAHLHLYGKGEARPGRKMGHVTRVRR